MSADRAVARGSDKPTLEAGIACEALCAMDEYSIGRMTYMPEAFLWLLEANAKSLISPWRKAIEDDVSQHIALDEHCDRTRTGIGPLGMECDVETWHDVLLVIHAAEPDKDITPGDRIVLHGNIGDWRNAICTTLRLAPGHGMPDAHMTQAIREIGLDEKWVANALRDLADGYSGCEPCNVPLTARAILDEYDASDTDTDDMFCPPRDMEKHNAESVRYALELLGR